MMLLRLTVLLLILIFSDAALAQENRLPPMAYPALSDEAFPVPEPSSQIPAPGDNLAVSPVLPSAVQAVAPDYFDLQRKKIMRWNDQTRYIMVYIADGSYLPGWDPQNIPALKAAFQEWETALDRRVHFVFMPDERGSDVKISWAARLSHSKEGEAAGINETMTWGKFIARNDIKLALMTPDGQHAYSPAAIQSVALHEIGHMLGLKAHSDNPDDVMYPAADLYHLQAPQHLTERDIKTMRLVYAAKPDYTNPEGYHLSNFDSFKKTQKGRHISLLWIPVPGVPFPIPIILPF